jgi:hypothetical protein
LVLMTKSWRSTPTDLAAISSISGDVTNSRLN